MASNQDDNAVFTGFWIDWDRGKVLGSTLTLRDSHAVPLVAALVMLVTLAGGRSWHICRLMWHSLLRAKDSHAQSVREHRRKQQVLIRNSETATGATMGLVKEWFSFGVIRVLRECSPKDILLGLFTIGHWVVFIVLGILVSQIVLGKVVVSKALPTCGLWFPISFVETGQSTEESDNIFNELQLNKTINSDNYVRSCYPQGGSEGRVDCNKFMVQSIPHKVEHGQPCPFDASACYPDAKSAVTLVSSNNQHESDFDPEDDFSGTAGYTLYKDIKTGKNFEIFFSLRNQFSEDYKLMSFWLPFVAPPEIVPAIRPNTTTGHEIDVIMLQGWGIKFVNKQDDIWFSAHQELEYTIPMKEGWHRYRMDAFVNMITCTEKFRFCSSITGQCTPYQGLLNYLTLSDIPASYSTLFGANGFKQGSKEDWDFGLATLLVESVMQQTALMWSIQQRGQAALQASRYLNNGEQVRLRPEQCKFELEYWFMMALARLQLEILNTIDKPANLNASRAQNLWATERYKLMLNLCGRIKFRSPDHTSLSAFGLIMILVFSGVLLLGSGIGTGLFWIPWTRSWKSVVEWRRDEVLALLEETKEENSSEVQDTDVEHASIVLGDKTRPICSGATEGGDVFQAVYEHYIISKEDSNRTRGRVLRVRST
ncbi:hypothetical protein B0J14DRAFT_707742 [Halenospora varia]|nr:hypothetical protein B0J14DRAFT_707742 [Halenospora varia]